MRTVRELRLAGLFAYLASLVIALLLSLALHLLLGGQGELGWEGFNAYGLLEGLLFLLAFTWSLALYEAADALYRYALAGEMTLAEAETLLGHLQRLGIRFFAEPWTHTRALELAWALGLKAAYDAHYLALAEGFQGAFWTADKRLHQRALEGQAQGLLPGVSLHLLEP